VNQRLLGGVTEWHGDDEAQRLDARQRKFRAFMEARNRDKALAEQLELDPSREYSWSEAKINNNNPYPDETKDG